MGDWKDVDDTTTAKAKDAINKIINLRSGMKGDCVNCFWMSDLNQAIGLLEEHLPHQYGVRLIRIFTAVGYMWECSITNNSGTSERYAVTHVSAAAAVCLAWLTYTDAVLLRDIGTYQE